MHLMIDKRRSEHERFRMHAVTARCCCYGSQRLSILDQLVWHAWHDYFGVNIQLQVELVVRALKSQPQKTRERYGYGYTGDP